MNPEMLRYLQAELARLSSPDGHRFDAQETLHIARQLEFVKSQTYDVVYPEFKARSFIPTSNEAPPGAESIVARHYDIAGMAKLIANYADDLPSVNASVTESSRTVKGIGTSFGYSIQDLRRAAMAGSQLDSRLAMAARHFVEQKIDEYAFTGEASVAITGFADDANVTLQTLPVSGSWEDLSPEDVFDNMASMPSKIVIATK